MVKKCPFMKEERKLRKIINCKNADVTETIFMNCMGEQCMAYDKEKGRCIQVWGVDSEPIGDLVYPPNTEL